MTLAVSVRLQYQKYSSMTVYWYRSVLLYFSMNGLISILLERIFYVNLDTFPLDTSSVRMDNSFDGREMVRCRVCRYGESLERFQRGWPGLGVASLS